MKNRILRQKEFVNFILSNDENYHTSKNIKALKRSYSLAVRTLGGGHTTEIIGDDFYIKGEAFNGNIFTFKFTKFYGTQYYDKIPTRVYPRSIKFTNGFESTVDYLRKWSWVKVNNDYVKIEPMKIMKIARSFDTISGLFSTRYSALEDALSNHKKCYIKVKAGTYIRPYFICIKPFFPGIKVGDVFNNNYDEYYNFIRSVESAYESVYNDEYRINLISEIPKPVEEKCQKAKYGCHRGCTHVCLSERTNKGRRKQYKTFVMWKEKLINEILKYKNNQT